MVCAYGGACEGTTQPFWIRSVGIPLCERHSTLVQTTRDTINPGADPHALELLAAAAVMVLGEELSDRDLLVV